VVCVPPFRWLTAASRSYPYRGALCMAQSGEDVCRSDYTCANLPILFASPRSVTWAAPMGAGDGLQTSAAPDGSWRIAPGPRKGDPDR
jgi:hypothetical protein